MNKFLIITGGRSGIGYATALLFQKENYKVINLSRSEIPLEGAIHLSVDLSNSNWHEEVTKVFQGCLEDADKISLIHNASKMQSDNVENFNANELRDVFEVNLVAPRTIKQNGYPLYEKRVIYFICWIYAL